MSQGGDHTWQKSVYIPRMLMRFVRWLMTAHGNEEIVFHANEHFLKETIIKNKLKTIGTIVNICARYLIFPNAT